MDNRRADKIHRLLEQVYWRKRGALPDNVVEKCPACKRGTFQWIHRLRSTDGSPVVYLSATMWCDNCDLSLWNLGGSERFEARDEVPDELIALVEADFDRKIPGSKMNSRGHHARMSFTP